MKHKLIPLLYSGLLGCAPKLMNPAVPEVILGGGAVAVTSPSEPAVLPPKQPSLEKMAMYVAASLEEIQKQKQVDQSRSIGGSISYGQGNYGFDYDYGADLFCYGESFQPLGKGKLGYEFRSIAEEPSVTGGSHAHKIEVVTVEIQDFPPFGKIDSYDSIYVNVAINGMITNNGIELAGIFPVWNEAQQFYTAMLRETYEALQEHQNKNASWKSFELTIIKDSRSQELDLSYTPFMQTLYAQKPFDDGGWEKKPYALPCKNKS